MTNHDVFAFCTELWFHQEKKRGYSQYTESWRHGYLVALNLETLRKDTPNHEHYGYPNSRYSIERTRTFLVMISQDLADEIKKSENGVVRRVNDWFPVEPSLDDLARLVAFGGAVHKESAMRDPTGY